MYTIHFNVGRSFFQFLGVNIIFVNLLICITNPDTFIFNCTGRGSDENLESTGGNKSNRSLDSEKQSRPRYYNPLIC